MVDLIIHFCYHPDSNVAWDTYSLRAFYVYILASHRHGTLYIGVTNDLLRRVYEHKHDLVTGFTKRYGVHWLVYFEETGDVMSAIGREKQLKWWRRQWKVELIERDNPKWKDLAKDWFDQI